MSLIHCPECQKKISDKAASCPDCGYPVPVKKSKQELEYERQRTRSAGINAFFGASILLLIFLGIILVGLMLVGAFILI
jgi:predicted nucleic acid-binding Zn ribbon protein